MSAGEGGAGAPGMAGDADLRRALAEAALLNAIAVAASGEEDLGQILSAALDRLGHLVAFTGGSIALVEGDDLVIRAAVGPFAEVALGQRLPRGRGKSWEILDSGEPFLSADLAAEGLRPSTGVRAYLGAPLNWRGHTIGLIQLDSTEPSVFDVADLVLLQKVAVALSGPVELARRYAAEVRALAAAEEARRQSAGDVARLTALEAELRARARQQAAVADLGQRALAGDDLAALLDDAARVVAAILGVEYALVLELLPDGETLIARAGAGWRDGVVGRARTGAGRDTRAGYTLASPEPVVTDDLGAETRFQTPSFLREHGVVSSITTVIGGVAAPYGVLGAHTARRRAFTADDSHFLRAVANVLAAAIGRRRAEDRLRESRDQLRVILGGVADAITAQDAGGRLVYANDSAVRTLGYPSAEALMATTRAEMLGRFAIFDEAGRPFPLDRLPGRQALRGREPAERTLAFRVLATGEERWAVVKARPVFDAAGRVALAISIFRDITAERRAAADVRLLAEASSALAGSLDSRATLAALAHLAVPRLADWCVVYLADEDGAARRLALVHADPAKQALLADLGRFHPPTVRAPDHPVARALREAAPILLPDVDAALVASVAEDVEHLRVLRALAPASAMVVPLVARDRTLGAIILVAAESGRRYGPADLVVAEELARRAALATDNARLYLRAQEALRTRDQFLSLASHELRTPVTSIRGYAQLLLRRHARDQLNPGLLTRSLDAIDEATDRLDRLTQDLLDVSRLQTDRFVLQPRPLDLAALLRRVVARYRDHLDARHRVLLDLAAEPCAVQADGDRLEQVLNNLLDNAAKYSPDGGDIHVALHPGAGAGPDGAAHPGLLLTVRDDGIGLPDGAAAAIFEPFGRAPNAAERQVPGLGLGLYICRDIVERHGGRIWAESAGEGRGTAVSLWLPK
ncbi:MAG TPA: GAF domain-containing protein [Thermomicrobiales bacterium]|nr:GAF domain-containing protein [Thermomicrobiales bacterium]